MKKIKSKIAANENIGGPFYRMRLESSYLAKNVLPGQFLEIRCSRGIDPLLRRPLGIHRITSEGIEVLYEVVGKGTELLSGMIAGRELDIIGPLGNGFDRTMASDHNIIVAGGIGAAPLLALAEDLVKEKDKKVHVMIGARTKSHVICEKEFRSLGCEVKTATDDGSKGTKGLVTVILKDLLIKYKPETYLPDLRRVMIYACGPAAMLKAVSLLAREHAVPCQVSLEEKMACGVGVCLGCPVRVKKGGYLMVCKDGPVFSAEDIAWE